MPKYCVFTKGETMYEIEADYFQAKRHGVFFFSAGEGIGFVPYASLFLVRLHGDRDSLVQRAIEADRVRSLLGATKPKD